MTWDKVPCHHYQLASHDLALILRVVKGHVRKLPVTWDEVSFHHYYKLASCDLALIL